MTYELNVYDEKDKLIYTLGRGEKDKDFLIMDLLDKLEVMLNMCKEDYVIQIKRID